MSNPSFAPGDRRVEDPQKDLPVRVAARAHLGTTALPLVVSHASSQHSEILKTYQTVTKTISRPIAPAPGAHGGATAIKPVAAHQISGLAPAALKKEVQLKSPLPLTSTTQGTPAVGPSGSTIPNIIEISSTSATHGISTLQVPNVSSIIRGTPVTVHHTTHLPRGMVATSHLLKPGPKMISVPRSGTPTPIQLPVSSAHTATLPPGLHSQIRGALLPGLRATTPTVNRPTSPAVSIGTTHGADIHRQSLSLHTISTTSTTPSIQITLQASRTTTEIVGKPVTTFQSAKLHVNPGLTMTSQPPKVVMSQPVTPVMHHQTLAAKANKGAPIGSSLSTVTVSLSTATVTIPIISGTTSASTIPIAKVPPQRQHPTQPVSMAAPSAAHTTTHDSRQEPASYPHPQPPAAHSQPHGPTLSQPAAHQHPPAHSQPVTSFHSQPATNIHSQPATNIHSQPATNIHSQPATNIHSQPVTSIFVPQQQKAAPVISSLSNTTQHTEATREGFPTMPFLPYMFAGDNPYYQQILRYQVAAVAAQGRSVPAHTTAGATTLQHSTVTQSAPQSSAAASVRLNPMLVMQDSLRHGSSQAPHPQFVPTSTSGGTAGFVSSAPESSHSFTALPVNSMSGGSIATVAAVASSLYTATSQPQNIPQIGQQAPNTPNSTPLNNPSASPRPSILRKRTNEGISAVKKQLAMTSVNSEMHHSPRPEPRPDSTPQSNMSSPKTPASGESQSSTDTALSSEATTPTQTNNDVRVKQEPHETQENGFLSNTEASPRKKPRKQLLNATEELKDIPVTINDFDKLVEAACVKEESPLLDDVKHEIRDEFVDDDGIRWTLEKNRSPVTLMGFYNISWKPKNNHFLRYTDVKPKDERRPTVNELSNQKGVVQKASGWKLFHMAAQIEDLVELEKELLRNMTELQTIVAPHPPIRHSLLEDEAGMLHELTQGNIQRCQLITDQLNESKGSMLKVLDHKHRIMEIVQKHISKRPIKKKERT